MGFTQDIDPPATTVNINWKLNAVPKSVQNKASPLVCSPGEFGFLPEEREGLQKIKDGGFQDSYRKLNPMSSDTFSWFDYRSRGFDDSPKRGLRIDHLWVTNSLYDKVEEVGIDYEIRAMEKPSDHAPVWTKFSI